jgi:phosphoribosylformylglycinamidine cyclo-ligase
MAHITGGGMTENLPRILPRKTAAVIARGSWPVLPLCAFLQESGAVDDAEMYRTFNMGIGMILVVAPEDVPAVREHFASLDEPCHEIGSIVKGDRSVKYD